MNIYDVLRMPIKCIKPFRYKKKKKLKTTPKPGNFGKWKYVGFVSHHRKGHSVIVHEW